MKKFALVVLIIGFSCALAASINDNSNSSALNTQHDSEGRENYDMERFPDPLSAFKELITIILSARKKMKCCFDEFVVIHEAISKLIEDVKKCDDDVGSTNTTASAIISDFDDILLQLNTSDSIKEDTKIQLRHKIAEEFGSVETITELGKCVTKAMNELFDLLQDFPKAIEKCLNE